jgi:hypothetical protein
MVDLEQDENCGASPFFMSAEFSPFSANNPSSNSPVNPGIHRPTGRTLFGESASPDCALICAISMVHVWVLWLIVEHSTGQVNP